LTGPTVREERTLATRFANGHGLSVANVGDDAALCACTHENNRGDSLIGGCLTRRIVLAHVMPHFGQERLDVRMAAICRTD
jgi:hypothetical protein